MQLKVIIGIIAGLLTSFAFLPQLVTSFRHRTPTQIGVTTILVFMLSQLLWSIYGILEKDVILTIFTMGGLVMYFALLCTKFMFTDTNKSYD